MKIETYGELAIVVLWKGFPVNTYSWELWYKERAIDFGGGFYTVAEALEAAEIAYSREEQKLNPGRRERLAGLVYRPSLFTRLKQKIKINL